MGPSEDHVEKVCRWDPDRVLLAEEMIDRRLTYDEIDALEYHKPLPESLPKEVRDRV